jgi:hypothetical protein
MFSRHQSYMPQRGSINTTYNEQSECTIEGEGELCFLFKIYIQTLQVTGLKDERGSVSPIPFSTAQSFMVDTLNPAVQV